MKVRELFSSREKWTKGALARDKDGKPISSRSDSITAFCLLGAIGHCYSFEETILILQRIVTELYPPDFITLHPRTPILPSALARTVSIWNDNSQTSFDMVKALVDKLDI